jgi:hypothetical protein
MLKIETGYIKKDLPRKINSLGIALLIIGLALGVISYALDPWRASYSYLVTFLFIISVGIGSLFLVALEYASGAVWSVPFRRVSEFFSTITPYLVILAIPLLFTMHDIFQWANPSAVESEKILQAKAPYLNIPFFVIRNIVIFLIWSFFYYYIINNSRRQDKSGDQILTKRNIIVSTIFMPVFALTISFVAFDWMMSIEPTWYSTIFGVYYFAGTTWCALAVVCLAVVYLYERGYLSNRITKDHFYSLGTLMFAFTAFWGYIAFSQYMLIWYGDLPEENSWFLHRWDGGWKYASILLVITHFIVPFFALLSSKAKTDFKRLKFMSVWIIINHLFDVYWMVMPGMVVNNKEYFFSWSDLVFPIAAVGLFLIVFSSLFKKYNLIPIGDPKLERGLEFHL